MADDEPWTSVVVAQGGIQQHGRDPQNLKSTLCGEVAVTSGTLFRGCFYGTGSEDCSRCAALLPDNHY